MMATALAYYTLSPAILTHPSVSSCVNHSRKEPLPAALEVTALHKKRTAIYPAAPSRRHQLLCRALSQAKPAAPRPAEDAFRNPNPSILSIDGGGVRGIVPARWLVKLEDMIRAESKDDNARIADYFDLIAGTSAGALLAAMLVAPPKEPGSSSTRFSAQQVLDIYLSCIAQIFPPPNNSAWRWIQTLRQPKWSAEPLEKLLKEQFVKADGQSQTTLSEAITPLYLTSYSMTKQACHYFSTMQARTTKYNVRDHELWKVCRASSAAPTYFAPTKIFTQGTNQQSYSIDGLVDGGLFANNPTLSAVTHLKIFTDLDKGPPPQMSDMLLLSLGTGKKSNDLTMETVSKWNLLEWVVPVISTTMMANQTDLEGEVAYQNWAENYTHGTKVPKNYVRLQLTNLPGEHEALDDASEGNLKFLEQEADKLLRNPFLRRDWASIDPDAGVPLGAGVSTAPDPNLTAEQALRAFVKELVAKKKKAVSKS